MGDVAAVESKTAADGDTLVMCPQKAVKALQETHELCPNYGRAITRVVGLGLKKNSNNPMGRPGEFIGYTIDPLQASWKWNSTLCSVRVATGTRPGALDIRHSQRHYKLRWLFRIAMAIFYETPLLAFVTQHPGRTTPRFLAVSGISLTKTTIWDSPPRTAISTAARSLLRHARALEQGSPPELSARQMQRVVEVYIGCRFCRGFLRIGGVASNIGNNMKCTYRC